MQTGVDGRKSRGGLVIEIRGEKRRDRGNEISSFFI